MLRCFVEGFKILKQYIVGLAVLPEVVKCVLMCADL